MKQKIYLYITIIGIVILGVVGYISFLNPTSNNIQFRTERIQRGNIVLQVRATGIINPIQTVKVGSQVSGTIAHLYADFNSVVKRGQIIAQIDSTFLYASVKEAEANLERAEAQVNEAKRNLDRSIELYNKQLVSQAELDATQTTYETAIAQRKQAQAALDRAKVNLRYSVIRAPIDGVVISRDVDVGQTVAASLQAPQLFTIANDLKQMQVEASVDEADIGQIKEGQHVSFTVDSYPDEEFSGTVTQVRLSPIITQNVVTYTVIINVSNTELKLRPGMTATVSILIDKRENVLRVPALALRFQPPEELVEKFQTEKPNGQEKTAVQQPESQQQPTRQKPQGRERSGAAEGRRAEQLRQKIDSKDFESKPRFGTGQVWVLNEKRSLKPVKIITGLNDNRYVEVLDGKLKEGDEIVLGVIASESSAMNQQQTNPFQPRMPSGSGRRGF